MAFTLHMAVPNASFDPGATLPLHDTDLNQSLQFYIHPLHNF